MSSENHVNVIIIGAGVAGLCAGKELTCTPELSFLIFDQLPKVGGVFARFAYPGLLFTSSTKTTVLSEFPWKNGPTHWTREQAMQYLNDFIDHFGFRSRLRLSSYVDECKQREDGKWEVRVKTEGGRLTVYTCDNIICAAGAHSIAGPCGLKGEEKFKGTIMHSSLYPNRTEEVKGKRVMIVGVGETGSDITYLVSKTAEKVYVSVRQFPAHSGTHYPKYFENDVADTYDSRMVYGLPNALLNVTGNATIKRFKNHGGDAKTQALFEMAAVTNNCHEIPRCHANSWGCKNFNVFKAMVENGTERKPAVRELKENSVVFEDGTEAEIDIIISGHGYVVNHPYLEKHHQDLNEKLSDIRACFKQTIHPEIGSKIMLAGYARPNMTSLWISAEMTARLAVSVLQKKVDLPPAEEMKKVAKEDVDFMRQRMGDHVIDSIPTLVYCLYFFDGIAEVLGAQPPILKFLFTDPLRALKILFGPICNAHYRFTGPNANPEAARETLDLTHYANLTPYIEGYAAMHPSIIALYTISLVLGPLVPQWRPVGHVQRKWPLYYWILVGLACLVTQSLRMVWLIPAVMFSFGLGSYAILNLAYNINATRRSWGVDREKYHKLLGSEAQKGKVEWGFGRRLGESLVILSLGSAAFVGLCNVV